MRKAYSRVHQTQNIVGRRRRDGDVDRTRQSHKNWKEGRHVEEAPGQ
jgi:hypothetical protein